MPYCMKCGNQMKDGDKFCGKCGNPNPSYVAPAVDNSRFAEYLKAKENAIKNYNQMLFYNPFAEAKTLSDKWLAIGQELDAVYALAQKNRETSGDCIELKNYSDDSKNRSNAYLSEITCKEYRENLSSAIKKYDHLLYTYPFEDICAESVNEFQILFGKANWLLENYFRVSNYDVDEKLVQDLHNNVAYMYCSHLLVQASEESGNDEFNNVYEHCKKCYETAANFKEERFKVVAGNAYFVQILNFENMQERGYGRIGNVDISREHDRCIQQALLCFVVLENVDYCKSVIKRHYFASEDDACEWVFMDHGVRDVVTLCDFRKDPRRKNRALDATIEAYSNAISIEEDWCQEMVDKYRELRRS